MTDELQLAKAQQLKNRTLPFDPVGSMNIPSTMAVGGFRPELSNGGGYTHANYHQIVHASRWYYRFDSIAGTVINRMTDMAATQLRNRRRVRRNANPASDEVMAYYDVVAARLQPLIKQMCLEYLLHGLVVPEYGTARVRGDLLSDRLGRTRYIYPEYIWIRNPDNLELKRRPMGNSRQVWLRIPQSDITLVTNKGVREDGTTDKAGYQYLVDHFPEYVKAINAGQTKFLLESARPILRKANSYDEYPTPYLTNALDPLRHKLYLKAMDRSTVARAIEAIRHVKIGNDNFPATDPQITNMREVLEAGSSSGELIYNLVTNHTVSVQWVIPPLDALLSESKYSEPNADIFLALGFPRILTTGETLRSNSSDSSVASLGPRATLDDMRDEILEWIKGLYEELAKENGFKAIPEPYFLPILSADFTTLVQFANDSIKSGAISKDMLAQLYGSDYETQAQQIQVEIDTGVPSPDERARDQVLAAEERAAKRQEQQAQNQQQQDQTPNNDQQ